MDANGKPVKRKQAVLETRKSIGKKRRKFEDGSEDEFQPAKAKGKAGPSKIKDEDDDFDDPPVKKPQPKKALAKTEESDLDVPQAKGKKAATKKEDSDFEIDDDPVPKKAAARPKKRMISKDSDSDMDLLDRVVLKGKGKEEEQSSKKRKRYAQSVPAIG